MTNKVEKYQITTDAVRNGIREGFLDLMDAAGPYPISRNEVIDAIKEGVKEAMAEHLEKHTDD